MVDRKNKTAALIFIVAGILLIVAGLVWVMNQPVAAVRTPTPAAVGQVERVSLADARAAFEAGEAVFVDVRDSQSYAATHIPGAVLIPSNEVSARSGELNPQAWIIPY